MLHTVQMLICFYVWAVFVQYNSEPTAVWQIKYPTAQLVKWSFNRMTDFQIDRLMDQNHQPARKNMVLKPLSKLNLESLKLQIQ